MRYSRLGILLLATTLALASAGCDTTPRQPLVELPEYTLELHKPTPQPVVTPARTYKPPTDSHPEWDAKRTRQWRYIVIHHSATDKGNAAEFDKIHREQRGWDELGYHFVITNGKGGSNGNVEVGSRWTKQKWGAHCGQTPNNEYNNHGIGICLVGNFCSRRPSAKQLASMDELVLYLVKKYKIPANCVIGHCDAPNAHTKCPGGRLENYIKTTLRSKIKRELAKN